MPRHSQLLLAVATLLLSACNMPIRIEPQRPAPPPRAATVAAAPVPALSAEARSALAKATARVAATKRERPGWTEADALIAQAQAAARLGNSAQVLSLAQQAQARADLAALGGQYTALATAQLQKLYTYTGLSDEQLARVKQAEDALARNEGHAAYEISNRLIDELKKETKQHKVGKGESLWTISARPDIYANPFLWPLIWNANRDTVKNPSVLRAGQTLKIKPNPTIDEVVQAVNFAREHTGTKINIGEIKEVAPEN
jgi:nucleoid-associated protein YgaU